MFFDITIKENALKFLNEFTRVDIDCIKSFIAKHVIHTYICTDATSLTAKNFINSSSYLFCLLSLIFLALSILLYNHEVVSVKVSITQ